MPIPAAAIPFIFDIAKVVVDKLVASPNNDITRADAPQIKKEVAEAIAPAIEHLTNNEPWYQSRVTWGAIIAAASPMVAPLIGRVFSPEEQMLATAVMTGIGSAFGAGTVLYGRWKAKKPIGA
ncbi:hypothetical protein [Microvirga brassicacearum]|uniref:Holin n=1 Tax=Microvirga brassicacearum TaxID=2580413 RepID=A0A5N3PH58_9HYPH|nr:hypothetical protein [Microvirga brassicacearum]KAB0269082.1 hypothetical protein FEZ63_02945 [Microvirga brassicacearum]